MITLTVPEQTTYELHHLVLDMNGTLTTDGVVSTSVLERLRLLATQIEVHVLTADTFGTASQVFQDLPLHLLIVKGRAAPQKLEQILKLGSSSCVAIGNGVNDVDMLEKARLGICVLGHEGASPKAIGAADIVVTSPEDALDLLLNTDRLRASLRG